MTKYKIALGFIFLLLCLSSCQEKTSKIDKNIVQDSVSQEANIQELKEYYDKAHGITDTAKFKRLFFSLFPKNFTSFNSIYGFDDKHEMPLYNFYDKHINYFCRLVTEQTESEGFNKLIRLGIGGHWDADAVNLLQDCIQHHVSENVSMTVMQLKQLQVEQIKSFWKFFYDGPHPEDTEIKKKYNYLFERINVLDTTIASLMKNEYKRLLKESEKHGE